MSERHVPIWTGTSVGPLVNTDTINELTPAAGVTVEGVLLEDNDITGADDIVSVTLTSDTVTANTEVKADVVSELTPTAGVTVDGVLLKDFNVSGTAMTADALTTDQISEKTPAAGVTVPSVLLATDPTVSTSSTTGGLIVTGGLGVGGGATVSGYVNTDVVNDISGAGVTVEGVVLDTNNVTADAFVANTEIQTDQIVEKTPAAGVTVASQLNATSGTASTSATTGALVVTGGMAVSGSVTVGGTVNTDVISEANPTAGVTIDGVLLKDNDITADEVFTDVITEKTATAGVTIDGVLLKDTTVTADNVTYNTETITDLTTTLSSSIRVSIIDLTTPLGVTTAYYDESTAGKKAVLPVAAVNGTRKTILLQEGQTDWITVETETAIGSYPWVRYFVLKPTQRVLHLKYETDHWEQDSQSLIDEYMLFISDHNAAETTISYFAFSEDASRYVYLDHSGSSFRDLKHYTLSNNDPTLVETIDLNALGCFAQTFAPSVYSLSLSYDGTVLSIGNPGNGTTDSGEVAIFDLTGGVFVHRYTFTPSVSNLSFGYATSMSADGTLLAVSDNSKHNIYTLGGGSATEDASFTATGGSCQGIGLSGDGHWMACGEVTGGNVLIYSDLPTGSWAIYQTISINTSIGSDYKFDYYGTTLVYGFKSSASTGNMILRYRLPGSLTHQFDYIENIDNPKTTNYYVGAVGYFNISDDGLFLAWRNRRYWGIQRRTSIQERFTPISVSVLPQNEGSLNCSPKGDLLGLVSVISTANYRYRVYKTRKTDENLNLIDSSETNARALIKGSGHVGGDLDVIGGVEAASISFDSGTNTLSTLVNETTWTTTISSLTNLTGTPAFADNIHQRIGDEVTAHTTITGLSTSGAGNTSFVIDTLPATPSTASCHIGTLLSNNNAKIGSVYYASSTATAVWTETSGAATTILLQLNYIAA